MRRRVFSCFALILVLVGLQWSFKVTLRQKVVSCMLMKDPESLYVLSKPLGSIGVSAYGLTLINGIGPAISRKVISYLYSSDEDLSFESVKGIGPHKGALLSRHIMAGEFQQLTCVYQQ